jgi:hypothetical protein
MSSFKFEPLHDWEWGIRAAFRLIWSHRSVLVPLALLMVVFQLASAPLEGVMAIQLPVSLPRIGEFDLKDILETLVGAAFLVAIITIFLKSAGVETSWRTRALAVFGIIGFELLGVLAVSFYPISKEAVEHPALEAIIWLTTFAFFIAWFNYAFCLAVQILVDGNISLSRSYKGVACREWRLWLSWALSFVVLLPVFLLQFGIEQIGEDHASIQTLLPHLETTIDALQAVFWSVTFGALSTIWFLHPRVRPPEESTTWEVPSLPQAR